MDRLTKKITDKNTKEVLAYRVKCQKNLEAVQKLGRLEDLEEQCAKENSYGLQMLLKKWNEFIEDIQELEQYRELKEQGKLLKLPCAVGDAIYYPYINEENEKKIEKMTIIDISTKCWQSADENWNCLEEIGKDVFLTKPEAEQALQRMNEMEG